MSFKRMIFINLPVTNLAQQCASSFETQDA